ncbi:MAG TPA: hypothetical protein DIC35_05175 [Candidatus Moranbacteria bacterium]|nr:hypothetical protein [Candidatus Moranbacteria bacterium]
MGDKIKIIRTTYLYLAIIISLIFTGVGVGTLINTALKTYVFPKAEKGEYNQCNQQPPVYALERKGMMSVATEDQKMQLENLLRDYEEWKKSNTGEECYSAQRQSNVVDSLTMIMVALPILIVHALIIKKDKAKKENE